MPVFFFAKRCVFNLGNNVRKQSLESNRLRFWWKSQKASWSVGAHLLLLLASPVLAAEFNLSVDPIMINAGEFSRPGIGYNGASPGPTLRMREGDTATIHVTNNLEVPTSIHWHGLILPFDQDGVPGISYPGIAPGETFTYRFPIVQSGTYWFHSHSGFQESDGAYGSIIIEPEESKQNVADREYIVQLTDKHVHSGDRIMRNLKLKADYYSEADISGVPWSERLFWGRMRMSPIDIEDVQGFTTLINGKSAEENWTGIFEKGDTVRLRLINSSAMTYFDVRVPGAQMMVVQADGNSVEPVTVDELRIAVGETYDVVVGPLTELAYTIFAESLGRTEFGRATLAQKEGLAAEIPELRSPPVLTPADMGKMAGMPTMANMGSSAEAQGMGNGAAMGGMGSKGDPFYATGSGLMPMAANGGKFLSYQDLRATAPWYEDRQATREVEIRLTGNMERYIWSLNGVKFKDAEPIRLTYGERVRFKFVNETMMVHPMHLHGMWSILDTGKGQWDPVKHTINIAPGTTVYTEVEVDAPGEWAFHCHLAYHADAGMFRKVIVEGSPSSAAVEPQQ